MSKNTIIISAFPGCGKTYFYENCQSKYTSIDSDSSNFSWVKDDNGKNTAVRNSEFPNNYISHIKKNIGKVDIIFVSSHTSVRDELVKENIHFISVLPDPYKMKSIWSKRLTGRGDSEQFVYTIMYNWFKFLLDMMDNSDHLYLLSEDTEPYINNKVIKECINIINNSKSPLINNDNNTMTDLSKMDKNKLYRVYNEKGDYKAINTGTDIKIVKSFTIIFNNSGEFVLSLDERGVGSFGISKNISEGNIMLNSWEFERDELTEDIGHKDIDSYGVIVVDDNTVISVSMICSDTLVRKNHTTNYVTSTELYEKYYAILNDDCRYIIDCIVRGSLDV